MKKATLYMLFIVAGIATQACAMNGRDSKKDDVRRMMKDLRSIGAASSSSGSQKEYYSLFDFAKAILNFCSSKN